MLLSTSSGSVEAAPPAVDGLTAVAAVVLLLRAGLPPGPARRRRRPQPEEAVVGRGRGEEGVLLGDHARLLVVGRVGLAQHQAARGGSPVVGRFTDLCQIFQFLSFANGITAILNLISTEQKCPQYILTYEMRINLHTMEFTQL